MIFGIVAGTVVSDTRCDTLPPAKYLLVQGCDHSGKTKDDYLVALDDIGAGPGEMVLISQGSSALQTEITSKKPIDAVIVGIVDLIDEHGSIAYSKQG
ncbi:MAG TPA: EutN/CcmL family microcompartment protein [Spirochaetota bacterium]|nr:EutN/CcmL family microcompartment protein [Spirochaetota bacterium]